MHRSGDGKFDIENIDPFLCSHAIYAYVGLNENGLTKIMDPYNDIQRGKNSTHLCFFFNCLKRYHL